MNVTEPRTVSELLVVDRGSASLFADHRVASHVLGT